MTIAMMDEGGEFVVEGGRGGDDDAGDRGIGQDIGRGGGDGDVRVGLGHVIADGLGLPAKALRIEAKVEGRPAVFYDQDGATLCACAVDSDHWRQARATAATASAIDKARTNF